jgi:hypothetical protein
MPHNITQDGLSHHTLTCKDVNCHLQQDNRAKGCRIQDSHAEPAAIPEGARQSDKPIPSMIISIEDHEARQLTESNPEETQEPQT